MEDDILGTRRAAEIAGRHQRTIVAWIHAGHLPAKKMPGNKGPYLIKHSDLLATIATLTTPVPYDPQRDKR